MNNTESVSKDTCFQFGSFIEQIVTELHCQRASFELPPQQSDLSEIFAIDYLLYNITRKRENEIYSTPPTCVAQSTLRRNIAKSAQTSRRSLTLSGFLDRESINNAINSDGIILDKDCRLTKILYRARRLIRDILGSHPNMTRILNGASYGNGASATLKRAEADRTLKWISKPSSTKATFELMRHFMGASPIWNEVLSNGDPVIYFDSKGNSVVPDTCVTFRNTSVLDMVPKTVDVDRIILKEPELNGFIQKGIGKEFRRLLRRNTGIDLNSSGVKNSELARYGSITGLLATIDAERASDSLTLALYEFLFPRKWYKLLVSARTPFVEFIDNDGQPTSIPLGMMSGMGNGFTFEAESIIFYALGAAACVNSQLFRAVDHVSIHGDDLIVPSDIAHDVMELYEICGIVVNKTKSFVKGPFRESCGGHFYEGDSVKPFYVTKETGANQGDFFWLYNSLLLWVNDRNLGTFCTTRMSGILKNIAEYAAQFDVDTVKHKFRKRPGNWSIPVDWSRREGLFNEAPKLHGAKKQSWRTQINKTMSTKACTDMYGSYMQSLAQPMHVTACDLIFGRDTSMRDPWEVDIDTVEAAGFRRTTVWNGFSDFGRTPLWFFYDLKMQNGR